ncbi:hypothetical protein BGW38_006896, partial [Lunasporangiospora selenospora]
SYSKVPAELVSLFTKNCQTCLGVRKYSKNKRPVLNEHEYPQHLPPSQQSSQSSSSQMPQQSSLQQHPSLLPLLLPVENVAAFATSMAAYPPHATQSYQALISKTEHGTISPISPMMSQTNPAFFGSDPQRPSSSSQSSSSSQAQHPQFHPGYGHAHSHFQQQPHQPQDIATANAQGLNMVMSFSDLAIGGNGGSNNVAYSNMAALSALSSIHADGYGTANTHSFQSGFSDLGSACSTPAAMLKMDLPQSAANNNVGTVNGAQGGFLASVNANQAHPYAALCASTINGLDTSSEASEQSPLQPSQHQLPLHAQFDDASAHGATPPNDLSASAAFSSNGTYVSFADQAFSAFQASDLQQRSKRFMSDFSQSFGVGDDPSLHSAYSAAMSLSSMPFINASYPYDQDLQDSTCSSQHQQQQVFQQHQQVFQQQHQQQQQQQHQPQPQSMHARSADSSALFGQSQYFHKQLQHSHKFLPEALMQSAVSMHVSTLAIPSMATGLGNTSTSSIPTPTSATAVSFASALHGGVPSVLDDLPQAHLQHDPSSLMDPKTRLGTAADLICEPSVL